MSRTTQYIGISAKARKFLEDHNGIKLCDYHMTEGMFNEPVMGTIYECNEQREGMYSCEGNEYMEDYKVTYIEIVQAAPWSSGPMIFTCLKNIKSNELIGLWEDEEIGI